MRNHKLLIALAGVTALTALVVAGGLTRPGWQGWLSRGGVAAPADRREGPAREQPNHVHLSPQARGNLRLVVKPVRPRTYWRAVQMPGTVVDRAGKSDRGVTAPIGAVVQRVAAVPGDTVHPGDELFTLRLVSEHLQDSQTQLYKAAQDLQISRQQRARLEDAYKRGALPEARILELDYQQQRHEATVKAYRQDLAARGLTREQIDEAAQGRFLTETTIRAPRRPAEGERTAGSPAATAGAGRSLSPDDREEYEVQELKVNLGQQVQPGQILCLLARHHRLDIEGRCFRQEVPLLARAAEGGWPVTATFAEEAEAGWPPLGEELRVRYLANMVDAASQTLPFYLSLPNQHREYSRAGKTYRIWRFRPGQRVLLRVSVEEMRDVFVVPADAVVRVGPEAYVFQEAGDGFDRQPVHLLYEDEANAVLANDGGVTAGSPVAQNGAAALHRALKARSADAADHGQDH